MKVLFLYPIPPPHLQEIGFQQGIASMSSVLKKHGHETRLEALYDLDEEWLEEAVADYQPDVVGLSVTHNQFGLASAASEALRRHGDFPIIMGGVHPCLCPDQCIAADGVTAICLGEGEMTLLELVQKMARGEDWSGIEGLWVNRNGEVIRNPVRPWVDDLDSLPNPDRELFDRCGIMRRKERLEVICSRGCDFGCSNCFHHGWRRRFGPRRGYVRHRSPERVLQEIREGLEQRPSARIVQFHDADLLSDPSWFESFAPQYARDVGLPFACNIRATSMTREAAALLRAANCSRLHIGVESGSELIRNKVLRKKVNNEELLRAFSLAREGGIFTLAFNMIGLPYETPKTIRQTIRLNRKLRANVVFASVFLPFPGTDLYDLCQKEGWITPRTVKSYFEHQSVLEQPTITSHQVAYYHRIFPWAVKYPWIAPLVALTARTPWLGGRRLYDVTVEPLYQRGFKLYRSARNWVRRRGARSHSARNS
jgi:anaerobic magnesium-protoporphyrin IX monomethyl ester cyclase